MNAVAEVVHTHSFKGYPYTKENCLRGHMLCSHSQGLWQCECGLKICTGCLISRASLGAVSIREVPSA